MPPNSSLHHAAAPRLIVMGVSGCGKSSVGHALASAIGVPMIEGDLLHDPQAIAKMSAGTALTDEDRWPWLDRIAEQMAALPTGGIATCSALRRVYRDRLRRVVGPDLLFVMLELPRAALLARMGQREGHFMPPALLDSQLATLEHPTGERDALLVDGTGSLDEIVRHIRSQLTALALH